MSRILLGILLGVTVFSRIGYEVWIYLAEPNSWLIRLTGATPVQD